MYSKFVLIKEFFARIVLAENFFPFNIELLMWKICFGLDLRNIFDSISSKLDRMLGAVENSSCMFLE